MKRKRKRKRKREGDSQYCTGVQSVVVLVMGSIIDLGEIKKDKEINRS